MIEDLLRGRRSIRRFKPDRPDRASIERLISLAITAPSASNKQPWRFFACDDPVVIARMAEQVQGAVDRIAPAIPAAYQSVWAAYGDYFVRFRAAPVVIAVAFKPQQVLSHLTGDALAPADRAAIDAMEFNSGLISTAMAIQNLLLAAPTLGLGTSCLTGPLVAAEALQDLLAIPAAWRLAALVAVGYPDEQPVAPERKPVAAVLRWVKAAKDGRP